MMPMKIINDSAIARATPAIICALLVALVIAVAAFARESARAARIDTAYALMMEARP